MKTTDAGAAALHTGPVFQGAPSPIGALWAELSGLEDEMAFLLIPHPIGSVFAGGSVGWALAMTERGLELVSGALVDGVLIEPQSRFELGLDWVDVDESDLDEQIATLRDAVARLEAGERPMAMSRDAAERVSALRAEVLQADPNATFVAPLSADGARVYVGPIAAMIDGGGFAQHVGRGVYAIHDLEQPSRAVGTHVEVKYRGDLAPSVSEVVGRSLER